MMARKRGFKNTLESRAKAKNEARARKQALIQRGKQIQRSQKPSRAEGFQLKPEDARFVKKEGNAAKSRLLLLRKEARDEGLETLSYAVAGPWQHTDPNADIPSNHPRLRKWYSESTPISLSLSQFDNQSEFDSWKKDIQDLLAKPTMKEWRDNVSDGLVRGVTGILQVEELPPTVKDAIRGMGMEEQKVFFNRVRELMVEKGYNSLQAMLAAMEEIRDSKTDDTEKEKIDDLIYAIDHAITKPVDIRNYKTTKQGEQDAEKLREADKKQQEENARKVAEFRRNTFGF